ncbi:MAG: amidase, partial [Chloroflexota bacterium]
YRVAPLMDQFRPDYYAEHTGPSLSAAGNLCGLPSISLPTGPGRLGLPTAIELMGAAWNDELVLAVGEEFQACTHWHTLQPSA